MELHVRFKSDIEERLIEHATAAGKTPEEFVVDAVREKMDRQPLTKRSSSRRSFDRWRRELDEFIARHDDIRHWVDDSRESMYDDRGA